MGMSDWLRAFFGTPKPAQEQRPHPPVRASASLVAKDSIQEHETQFRVGGPEKLYAYMGLDLGTSCAKVVIQTPFVAGGRAVAVPFGPLSHHSNPYLLPTCLYENVDGTCSLSAGTRARPHQDLKVRLLESLETHPARMEAAVLATAYLAMVIRKARTWFLATQGDVYGARTLAWALNVGIPSNGYDKHLEPIFERIAAAAWSLSTEESPPRLQRAGALLETLEIAPSPPVPIAAVPEVVAEVIGYARSRLRNPGLHILMDVGARTLDLCAFNLFARDGEDNYALLTADVSLLGSLELHKRRQGARKYDEKALPEDPVLPIPNANVVSGDVDRSFLRECRDHIFKTLIDLRVRRDPLSARWQSGIPVFLGGGGSRMKIYRDALEETEKEFRRGRRVKGLRIDYLPRPDTLANEDVAADDFTRLAVAYGLSFDKFDIGKIQPPGGIEDIPPPRKREQPAYVDKDQV